MRELWTVARTAEALGCSEDTVRRLIHSGQLPAVNVSARLTRIFPEDVAAYMEGRRVKVAALRRQTRVTGPKERRGRREPLPGGVNNSGYTPGMKVVDPHG